MTYLQWYNKKLVSLGQQEVTTRELNIAISKMMDYHGVPYDVAVTYTGDILSELIESFNKVTMKATLTFPSRDMAKKFASEWAHYTLTGNDMSATKDDGSVDVTVYDVTNERKKWIDSYISQLDM